MPGFYAKRLSWDTLRRRTPLIWIFLAAVLSLCVFVSAVWMSPLATYLGMRLIPSVAPLEEPKQVSAKRTYLRAGSIGTEGLGVCGAGTVQRVLSFAHISRSGQSTLHHFKHSIVLSGALDSSLIFSWDVIYDAKHEIDVYSTSRIWNGEESPIGSRAPSLTIDARKTCRISDQLPSTDRAALVRGLCSGEEWASEEMERIKLAMQDCTSIVDTEYSEVISPFPLSFFALKHHPTAYPRPQRVHHGLDPRPIGT
jgi:hypothetical protein